MENNSKPKDIKCGKGKSKFDGDLIEVKLCLSDIPAEHRWKWAREGEAEKWYTKIKVKKSQYGADDYGNTHYVVVDTYNPEQAKKDAERKKQEEQMLAREEEKKRMVQSEVQDDLPF